MGLQRARRWLLRAVVALYLMVIVAALVLVWTASSREWFIDTGGAAVTLSMDLSSTVRLLATVLLGGLALLGLLAVLVDAAATRREQALLAMSARMGTQTSTPPDGQRAAPVGRTASVSPVVPPFSHPPAVAGQFDSVVVGDQATQRLERSITDQPPEGRVSAESQQPVPAGMGQPADDVTHQIRRTDR